jgi:ABC-type transport system substrate-binding protein
MEAIASFDGTSLAVQPEECGGAYQGLIQSVTASDEHTVKFTLCRADPDFLFRVSLSAFGIFPSEWIEATAKNGERTSEALEKPVGTGPYQVTEWKRGESITLAARDDYWGGAPVNTTLTVHWADDPAARLADLQAGIADGIDTLGPDDFPLVRADPLLALVKRPQLSAHESKLIAPLTDLARLAGDSSAAAYRADVVNPQASPLGAELFHLMAPAGREEFIWLQSAEPASLFCADEADPNSLRICAQIVETLYRFDMSSAAPVPTLAEACEPNGAKTVWTCALRRGILFHDGSPFDAADVVATFNMGLNPASPTHSGHSNLWDFYKQLWGLLERPTSRSLEPILRARV